MLVDPRLVSHRQIWSKKPALRKVYADYYQRIARYLIDGPTLEIGSGSGYLREYVKEIYMADILPAPWLAGQPAQVEGVPGQRGLPRYRWHPRTGKYQLRVSLVDYPNVSVWKHLHHLGETFQDVLFPEHPRSSSP